jgi:hypothetical protein
MSVESTSITTRRCARRCSPEATTATSTSRCAASSASSVRSCSVAAPETSNSTAVTGYLASRRMRSMLLPVCVILAAMAAVASAVSGWPSTVTCERPAPRGRLSPVPEMISAWSRIDSAQPCTVARSSPSKEPPCAGVVISAHRVMRPRVTTCSRSTTFAVYRARVSNRPAVMPGRSLPKIFTSSVGVSSSAPPAAGAGARARSASSAAPGAGSGPSGCGALGLSIMVIPTVVEESSPCRPVRVADAADG